MTIGLLEDWGSENSSQKIESERKKKSGGDRPVLDETRDGR
jgi:hypothetical protein